MVVEQKQGVFTLESQGGQEEDRGREPAECISLSACPTFTLHSQFKVLRSQPPPPSWQLYHNEESLQHLQYGRNVCPFYLPVILVTHSSVVIAVKYGHYSYFCLSEVR